MLHLLAFAAMQTPHTEWETVIQFTIVWVGNWSWPQMECWLGLLKHPRRAAGHFHSSASGCWSALSGVMEVIEPHVFDPPAGLFTWEIRIWRMREKAKMTGTFQFCDSFAAAPLAKTQHVANPRFTTKSSGCRKEHCGNFYKKNYDIYFGKTLIFPHETK